MQIPERERRPSCATCKHGSYFEDRSVGIDGYYECTSWGIDDIGEKRLYELEEFYKYNPNFPNEFEFLMAEACGSYEPIIVEKCEQCGKPMNMPLHEVEYLASGIYDCPPVCSKECDDAYAEELRRDWLAEEDY